MSGLHLQLLGSPQVLRDGRPLHFDTRKAVALLAVLALSRVPRGRAELAALLWPESEPERARAALRRTLSVTAAVGDALVVARDSLRLQPDAVRCDVAEFEKRAKGTELRDLRTAAGLYRGDFLAGFAVRDCPDFDEWQLTTAAALRSRFDGVLAALTLAEVRAGRLDAAEDAARRRLAVDALNEPAHQDLIRVMAWAGNRPAALRQYRALVRVLDRELGVPPLPDTTALYDAVRAGTLATVGPPPQPEPAARPTVEPARTAPTVVGRAVEAQSLERAWRSAAGVGRVVTVGGDSGSGKTTLLQRLAERVRAADAAMVTVTAHEGEQGLALAAVTDLVRALTTGDPALASRLGPADRTELSRLQPDLAPAGTPVLSPLATPGGVSRLYGAVRSAVDAALTRAPAPGLLVLEDLHWLDNASSDALSFLVRRLPANLLVVLTWRGAAAPGRLAAAVADCARSGIGDALVLGPLSSEEVAELLGATGLPAGEGEVAQVLARTGGLPLLVAEHAAVELAGGPGGALMSTAVRDLMRARVEAAPATSRQLLAAAAVVAAPADPQLLRAATGRSAVQTVDALEDAVARGLLVSIEARGGYDFPNDALRQLITEATSPARRTLLHGRIADALIARAVRTPGAVPAATVARHLALAGRDAEAAGWHWRAAQEARALFAHADALGHLQAALASGHPAAQTHEAMGDTLILLGRYPEAIGELERAAAMDEDGSRLVAVEHKLAEVHHRLGEWALAEAHLESALAALDGADDPRRARVLADLALLAHRQGEDGAARRSAEDAVRLASSHGDPAALAQALNVLGVVAAGRGATQKAREHFAASLAQGRSLDDPAAVVAVLNNLARLAAQTGDVDAALGAAEEALELGRRHGDLHRVAALRTNLADLMHAAGRDQDADEQLRAAATLFAAVDRDEQRRPAVWTLVEW